MSSSDHEPAPREALVTRSRGGGWLSFAIVLVGAVAAALALRTWVVQTYWVPTGSMQPTIGVDERVLVNKLSGDPERGDIVVFDAPAKFEAQGMDALIKRVVGLGGETLELRDGSVFIDGTRLDEPYLPDGVLTVPNPINCTTRWEIPEGHVFVMGDNRTASDDGRDFGPIPESSVVGRAFVRVWPVSRFGTL